MQRQYSHLNSSAFALLTASVNCSKVTIQPFGKMTSERSNVGRNYEQVVLDDLGEVECWYYSVFLTPIYDLSEVSTATSTITFNDIEREGSYPVFFEPVKTGAQMLRVLDA